MANIIDYLKETNLFDKMGVDEIFNEILDGYMGTCNSISDVDRDWLDLNGQFENWDSFIFLCDCGWWCDVGERTTVDDTEYCDDCKPEED